MLPVQGSEIGADSAQPALDEFVVCKTSLLLSWSDTSASQTGLCFHELADTYT